MYGKNIRNRRVTSRKGTCHEGRNMGGKSWIGSFLRDQDALIVNRFMLNYKRITRVP